MTGFELYKQEVQTLPFTDYGLIMDECKRVGAKNALEFGPGYSTLALIEAGLKQIVACEHDPKWFAIAEQRFADYPQVELIKYLDVAPVAEAPRLAGVFDIALVDSPKGYAPARLIHEGQEDCSRLNTCLLALQHAPVVLLHDANRPLERGTLGRLNAMGHRVTWLPAASPAGLARIERNENQDRSDS